MNEILFAPPIAFLAYLLLSGVLSIAGRLLAGPVQPSRYGNEPYASGEKSSRVQAAPGYRPFFTYALFFAILHLGVLMLGSGGLSALSGIYMVGLILALVALMLG